MVKTLALSALLLFNAILFGDEPIPITLVPSLFTEAQIRSVQASLDQLLTPWKLSKRTRRIYAGTELKQLDILITSNRSAYNFIKLDFNTKYELTKKSLKTLEDKLCATHSSIKPIQKELKKATIELFVMAVQRFAKQAKLEGEHFIRCDIRGFVVYLDEEMEGAYLTNKLGWHWDYCSHSTLVTELSSDFEAAELLFARNLNSPPLPNCTKPANHHDAIPDEKTLTAVHYPKNGALFFPSERGGIVHFPQPPLAPPGKHGLLMRIILQVVLMDQEWLSLCEGSDGTF